MTLEEQMKKLQEIEADRKRRISEQIRKGCSSCSQWDDYWGCDKCESLMGRKEKC